MIFLSVYCISLDFFQKFFFLPAVKQRQSTTVGRQFETQQSDSSPD